MPQITHAFTLVTLPRTPGRSSGGLARDILQNGQRIGHWSPSGSFWRLKDRNGNEVLASGGRVLTCTKLETMQALTVQYLPLLGEEYTAERAEAMLKAIEASQAAADRRARLDRITANGPELVQLLRTLLAHTIAHPELVEAGNALLAKIDPVPAGGEQS